MPKITYRASTIAPLVSTGTATKSFFAIVGSATANVVVTRIRVSAPTTTAVAYNAITVCKNSTASASPGATLTAVPLSSKFAAATAVVSTWTADQTVGTLVGVVDSWRCLLQATTAAAGGFPDYHVFNFADTRPGRWDSAIGDVGTAGIHLHGAAQELSLQWAASVAAAATLSISIEWIEETLNPNVGFS